LESGNDNGPGVEARDFADLGGLAVFRQDNDPSCAGQDFANVADALDAHGKI